MKRILITASAFGILAVLMGAFGAHSIRGIVDAHSIEIFNKGVQYQFYHVFAIIACALLFHLTRQKRFIVAARLFVAGICCFSGSLYLLAVKDLLAINTVILGPITPLGGVFFIAGWCLLMSGVIKLKQ